MSTRRFPQLLRYALSVLVLSVGLAGCGGGGGGNTSASGDSFIDRVLALVTTSQENDPPISTDGIAVTAPENTGPVAVQ